MKKFRITVESSEYDDLTGNQSGQWIGMPALLQRDARRVLVWLRIATIVQIAAISACASQAAPSVLNPVFSRSTDKQTLGSAHSVDAASPESHRAQGLGEHGSPVGQSSDPDNTHNATLLEAC